MACRNINIMECDRVYALTHSHTPTYTHTVTANTHANQRPQHKRVVLTRFIFMASERQNQCQCALCGDLCAIKIDNWRPTKPTDEIGPNDYERQQQAQVSNMLPFLAESTNETLAAVVQLQLHTQHTHTQRHLQIGAQMYAKQSHKIGLRLCLYVSV